jgi:hypothetical protein
MRTDTFNVICNTVKERDYTWIWSSHSSENEEYYYLWCNIMQSGKVYWHSGGMCCLHLQNQKVSSACHLLSLLLDVIPYSLVVHQYCREKYCFHLQHQRLSCLFGLLFKPENGSSSFCVLFKIYGVLLWMLLVFVGVPNKYSIWNLLLVIWTYY